MSSGTQILSRKKSNKEIRGVSPGPSTPSEGSQSSPRLLTRGLTTAMPQLKKKPSVPSLKRNPSWKTQIGSPTNFINLGDRKPNAATVPERGISSKVGANMDIDNFAQEDFQSDEYIQKSLVESTEDEVFQFRKNLYNARQTIGVDLQKNVYRNYTEFVVISKEISSLESDMLVLRDLAKELRAATESFRDDSEGSGTGGQELMISRGRSASTAQQNDMQSIWKAQMAALWEGVEGSQKYLPFQPGRHIVLETPNVVELRPETLKTIHHCRLFLLTDSLLVASLKKKRTTMAINVKLKLIADKCWRLGECVISDIKDTSDTQNLVKIIAHSEHFVFRCANPDDKLDLLMKFKRMTEELLESRKREREAARQKTESVMFNSSTVDFRVSQRMEQQGKDVLPPADMRWLVELPDELDVFIAQQEFDQAVVYVEKAKVILHTPLPENPRVDIIRTQLEHYTDLLAAAISRDLENPLLTKAQFQRNVNWLLRLDLGETAREVFLQARSVAIRSRIRQLTFEGDVTTYISELALIVFTIIKGTAEWYRDSFKDNRMASGFVKWAHQEVENYTSMFRKQVFNHNQMNFQVIAECLKSTEEHCDVLRRVGLDLNFAFYNFFHEDLRDIMITYEERDSERLSKIVSSDNFTVVASQNLGNEVKVTSSVVSFYNIIIQYVNDITLIARLPLYGQVIESVSNLTELYLTRIMKDANTRELSKDQRYAAMMNVSFVLDNIIPRVGTQLSRHFDRPIPDIDSLRERLRELTFV